MSNSTDTKPEPISAKPNWHYDSYFLSQLDRLNTRKQDFQYPEQLQPEQGLDQIAANASPEMIDLAEVQERQLQDDKRNEVVDRINELALSIGISVTIIEKPEPAV